MILKTKHEQKFNTEKIWAVEWGFTTEDGDGNPYIYWTIWKKYTSQRRMLQALRMLQANENESRFSLDGGETWKTRTWVYRPTHVDYTWEYNNLCKESLREYKLKQLLNKN